MSRNSELILIILTFISINTILLCYGRDHSGNFSASRIFARPYYVAQQVKCDIKRADIARIRLLGANSYAGDLVDEESIFAYYTALKKHEVFFENKLGGRRYVKDGEKCFNLLKEWYEASARK